MAQASGYDGLLTVSRFTSSPVKASDSAASAYFDVRATGSNVGSGAVALTFTDQAPNVAVLYYHDGHWQYVTDASGARVRTDATGKAIVTITTASTPAVTGLSGDFFQVGQAEADSLVVDTTEDVVDATDNLTSLREALAYAESLAGPQTITFAPALAGQTIDLTTVGDSTDDGDLRWRSRGT